MVSFFRKANLKIAFAREHTAPITSLDSSSTTTINDISTEHYASSAGSIWTGRMRSSISANPRTQNGQLVCSGSDWNNNVVIPQKQVLTDIANNQLAQVIWVNP